MSLTNSQVRQTAAELAENLKRSGLSVERLAGRASIDVERTRAALSVRDCYAPADVWLVRDKLETAVIEAGAQLMPYSKLTEAARSSARIWFGVEDRR